MGWCADEIIGQSCTVFFTPEMSSKTYLSRNWKRQRSGATSRKIGGTFGAMGPDFGAAAHFQRSDPAGELVGFTKIIRDMTKQRDTERLMQTARNAYGCSLNMLPITRCCKWTMRLESAAGILGRNVRSGIRKTRSWEPGGESL